MKNRPDPLKTKPNLRQRAEKQMRKGVTDISKMPLKDIKAVVHELEVHQVELEIQNQDLRDTQLDLAEARDLYLDLYESAPVGYMTLDRSRVIRQANLTAASMLGVDRGRLIGARLSKFASSECQDDIYLHAREALISGTRQVCEVEFQRPDGSRFFGNLDMVPQAGPESRGNGLRVILSDVTARKEAELGRQKETREKEEALSLLEAIFEAAPIGLGFWDKEMRFVRLNRALAEINGHTMEYHIGKTLVEVLPELGPTLAEPLDRILRDGEPSTNREVKGRTPAHPGETRHWIDNFYPVRMGDEIIGLAATVQDVTQLKRTQEELEALNQTLEQHVEERTRQLKASREEYRSRIESIPHMVWSISTGGGGEYCNRRTLDYLGITLEEMKEGHWDEAVHPEDVERVKADITEMLRTGRERRSEMRLRRAEDNAYRWHAAHAVPVRDADGRILRWLGTCTEIHEQKEAEAALRQMSLVFRDSAVPIFVGDDRGRIVDVNQESERVFGWSGGRLMGRPFRTVVSPEGYEPFDRLLERCRGGDHTVRNEEMVMLTESGEKLPVLLTLSVLSGEPEGRPIRIAVIAKDISRIKSTEEALRASEGALREEKRKLEDKNIALREILEQIEREKWKIREDMAANVEASVLPVLDRLAEREENRSLVVVAKNLLEDLASPFGRRLSQTPVTLTAREKEVCRMVKGGLTSKEISHVLTCAPQTVEKHRKNIRKKLGITGKGANLGSYLSDL